MLPVDLRIVLGLLSVSGAHMMWVSTFLLQYSYDDDHHDLLFCFMYCHLNLFVEVMYPFFSTWSQHYTY